MDLREQIRSLDRVFHSEADFQHSLAWEIHKKFDDVKVRLEKRIGSSDTPSHSEEIYVDIWVELNASRIPIELKYKTSEFSIKMDGEEIQLRSHAAHPPNRFDIVNDVERTESIVRSQGLERGYMVFLTNDPAYWKEPSQEIIDADFRLHDEIGGRMTWSNDASLQTISKKRDRPIELENHYPLNWKMYGYSEPEEMGEGNALFQYIVVEVNT
jgi:hypothetical protein